MPSYFTGTKPSKVEAQHMVCSELSMAFFDRLFGSVARENGKIEKCFDEYYDDMVISDELRKVSCCVLKKLSAFIKVSWSLVLISHLPFLQYIYKLVTLYKADLFHQGPM